MLLNSSYLTYPDTLPTIYTILFILGQTVPYMADFHSTASDIWVHVPGWARGQYLGHLKFIFLLWNHFVFEQEILFLADLLSVTFYLRVHDPVWVYGSNIKFSIFLTYADILPIIY